MIKNLQRFAPMGGRNVLLDWVSEVFANAPLPLSHRSRKTDTAPPYILRSLVLGEGRISIQGTSIRNSGEGSSNTSHHKHCVAIQKKIDVKAGLLRKQGLLFTRNDRLVAFTLAEVLITLGIIGVVAAMTIPTLVADYQERSFNTSATVFERKLGEALKVMNTQQTLAGHTSTESFVNELKKHIKVTKTCANDKLMDCFVSEVFWGSGDATPEVVDMNTVKTSKNFGQKDWKESNVIGVQFADGVSALVAYNKDAKQDPYSNQIVNISGGSDGKKGSVSLGTTALAILYDTNGFKSPNKSAKDVRSINVTKLGKGCFAEANGVCIAMKPQVPTPHRWNTCRSNGTSNDPDDLAFMREYGIKYCYHSDDFWAGAVKLCGGTDKMASQSDLVKIANYVYNTDSVKVTGSTSNLTFDATKASELGLPSPAFSLWSGEEDDSVVMYGRDFRSTNEQWSYLDRNFNNILAVCLGD